jgi:putative phosphoesterase
VIVGIISDTHGLLRPEAVRALDGSEMIIHAGDVGSPEILERLAEIAPVTAVRGNIDKDPWAQRLPLTAVVEAGPARLYVIHDLKTMRVKPAGYAALISGHSHKSHAYERDGVLYLNPGAAGPRRFRLPVSLARLYVGEGALRHEILYL